MVIAMATKIKTTTKLLETINILKDFEFCVRRAAIFNNFIDLKRV